MTKLFTKLFRLSNPSSKTATDNKTPNKVVSLIPYTAIPQHYQPPLGKGDLNEAGLDVSLDHLEVFDVLCRDAVLFILRVFHLLQTLQNGDTIKDDNEFDAEFGAKFHEKFKQTLSQLPYVNNNNNTFNQDQIDGLHFLFNDLKYTWNVVTVANSLKLVLDDVLKHNVNEYFKKIWAFEVSESDDRFLIDVFSVSLDIWERRVVALVVSKE
ncbi:hypothetical protein CANMA_002975 [Candida margitis]|uniref:uncharacterized protein n=1 Tax=Candida margitis TaxID=1775924 RepID=UPI002226C742|nr:uncharacterized protein CANMA_002975 [Candida margitis]KAI5967541.1 hypothetical protein CANMA_002975 [Candida margitis]